MEEALRAHLLATAAVNAMVQRRIDWVERSQGDTMPALVLHLISNLPEMKLSGPTGWWRARVQADAWGGTHLQARNLARAVATAINAFHGTLSGIPFRIFVIDGDTRPDSSGAKTLHRSRVDLTVIYYLP